jgi:hypothetical protein
MPGVAERLQRMRVAPEAARRSRAAAPALHVDQHLQAGAAILRTVPPQVLTSGSLALSLAGLQRAYGNRATRNLLSGGRQRPAPMHLVSVPAGHLQRCGELTGSACPCHGATSSSEATTALGRLLQRDDAPPGSVPAEGTGATETAGGGEAKAEEKKEEAKTCALITYSGTNFTGDTVKADTEFKDSLETIDKHAGDNKVKVHVTDSFRESGAKVKGAIVTPATRSNHLAGHAIDMNVKYGEKDTLCNSTCLKDTAKHPAGVKEFIKAIQDDSELRWGGDFKDVDPVHIDDNLNSDDEAWKKRHKAVQEAAIDKC